ncbi:hypothetical protein BC939DRAFT_22264 [Gamsiella multidivaricata]|uniref:uncharacterized protein n=1 Tax=Gamsiella multidivaricata TaxID=101098 RepID=UPI00221F71D0|nr:uncharacterized protein BC939DRAFT_22264 [Gamsiella multidivaricata]KAI7816892.1 hypothetical protein BC939DRAFT_22264 [Gamsiella multidivaricata]
MPAQANNAPDHATTSHSSHQADKKPWSIKAQRLKDEQIQAFCREYAKRIATVLTQHTATEAIRNTRKEHIVWPSPEALMELYTKLLREEGSIDPKIREILSDKSFVVSSFTTNLAEKLEQQLGHSLQLSQQREPCGCGIDHNDHISLDFPDDSYEDEPDEEDYDDEDEDDEDEDDEDEDDEDDEDYDDDEYDGTYDDYEYSRRYAADGVAAIALEEEKRQFAAILKLRSDKNPIDEDAWRRNLYDAQKRKQEEERIQLLQRLRLEDEQRRKRESQEKQRKEKVELEARRKRETAEADQAARSFLFKSALKAHVDVVKRMVEISPAELESMPDIPRFHSASTTRITGWESMTAMEDIRHPGEGQGMQETLLHVAVRAGCLDLVVFFITKGISLDVYDSEGRMPLHTAAESSAPLEICRLLVEKAPFLVDKSSLKSGKTALHYAAQSGCGDLVAMLLQHHARISIADVEGNTPEMLAKAGLDREKSSKAKAQKYRAVLQHLQKAVAAIKEAQRQKDAFLEELRRKELELMREEEEKDRAARRKQEEKLEADQRRREEEEKELARLKASAAGLYGNNGGGGGGKKKKKKKGKGGNDAQMAAKETSSTRTLAAPVQPSPGKSGSPSPIGSPAASQPSASPATHSIHAVRQLPIQLTTHAVISHTISAIPAPSTLGPLSKPSMSGTVTFSKPSTIPLALSRLPKAKTNYRPSQLVVTRMADMGFPERDVRKALIQTEGRFEEAIELLTSSAPLADDSEDEAERIAEEATRRKAMTQDTPLLAPTPTETRSSNIDQISAMTVTATQSTSPELTSVAAAITKSADSQQSLLGLLTGSEHQSPSSSPASKGPFDHSIQILQRPRSMAPHVQMRSVPTQVLQRPSSYIQVSPPAASGKPQLSQESSAPFHTHSSVAANTSTTAEPFLAPLAAPPVPPTRARYLYGSSSVQSQGQPPTVPLTRSLSPDGCHYIPKPAQESQIQIMPALAQNNRGGHVLQRTTSMRGNDANHHSSISSQSPYAIYGTSASASTEASWETQPGVQNAFFGLSPIQRPTFPANGFITTQGDLWRAIPQSCPSPSRPFEDLLRTNTSAGYRRASFEILAASTDRMLHQSQMDTIHAMDDAADGSMIKDVLAMTGAIDLNELEDTLSDYSLTDTTGTSSRPKAQSSAAVGEGRTQATNGAHNPVASLWKYGSFTQDISSMTHSWSLSSSSQKNFDVKTDADQIYLSHRQRNTGLGLGLDQTVLQTSNMRMSSNESR